MATDLTLPASGAISAPRQKPRRGRPLPRWTDHLHFVSTALLIVTVIALAVALFGANGIGRNGGNGEPNGNLAAVPLATVEPEAESSSIPVRTAAECTVESMTRDEVLAHLEAANIATAPEFERYERGVHDHARVGAVSSQQSLRRRPTGRQ